MREILFRGKRTDNGEWVEGYYYKAKYCRTDDELCDYITVPHPKEYNEPSSHYIVDPETVGQYTGLKDKNGKRIFEGDIIKYKNTDGIKFNGVALTVIGKVVYNEKNASFAISGKDEIGAKYYDYFPIKNIEVIGNIHDDPELLRGDTNA